MMKVSGLEDDLPLVWEYLKCKVAPFISNLFIGVQDSSCIISQNSPSTRRTVWDILADVKHPLSKKQANTAFKKTFIKGQDCLSIAYDVASTFLRNAMEGKSLLNELTQLPNAMKGRIHFLSPDSDKEYLRMSKGKDVYGKSALRQCVSVPFVEVPEKLLQVLHAANVMKELPPSSSTTFPARNDQASTDQTSTDQTSTDQASADQTSADQTSTDQASTDQASADQTSADQASADDQELIEALDEVETSFTDDNHAELLGKMFQNLQKMQCDSDNTCNMDALSAKLEKIASDKGFMISDNEGSGNCMFYALSEQLYLVKGTTISHEELRQYIIQYLRKKPKLPDGTDLFNFVNGYRSWADYLTDMEQDGTWGDHVILYAAANCFDTFIHVISSQTDHHDLTIRPDHHVTSTNPLVLGHVHEVHYLSLKPRQVSKPESELGTSSICDHVESETNVSRRESELHVGTSSTCDYVKPKTAGATIHMELDDQEKEKFDAELLEAVSRQGASSALPQTTLKKGAGRRVPKRGVDSLMDGLHPGEVKGKRTTRSHKGKKP